MDDYNFWQDFFDTYQSLSDWMKLAWLIVPPAFLLAFVALFMRYRLACKRRAGLETHAAIRDENGMSPTSIGKEEKGL